MSNFLRVALVGAGPSLDDSIDYLQAHQQDFIIIACGTAITPLLKRGIRPDYHVHQERLTGTERIASWGDPGDFESITALKLNVIPPEIDELFEQTWTFQKFNDPASSLLSANFAVTKNVNPTVTNCGIAFATELGAGEIYLFGVDYGAGENHHSMHAKHYIDSHLPGEEVDKSSPYTLPGNLGGVITTTDKLMLSHNITEIAVASHPKINWFNVGEGALIRGAEPLPVASLVPQFDRPINKPAIKKSLAECFSSNYSAEEMVERLEQQHAGDIADFLQAVRGFLEVAPTSRSQIICTLSVLSQAVDEGQSAGGFIPDKLYAGGIKRFIEDLYLQTSLTTSDIDAVTLFEQAKVIFADYLDAIEADTAEVIADARRQLDAQHGTTA